MRLEIIQTNIVVIIWSIFQEAERDTKGQQRTRHRRQREDFSVLQWLNRHCTFDSDQGR